LDYFSQKYFCHTRLKYEARGGTDRAEMGSTPVQCTFVLWQKLSKQHIRQTAGTHV